jgi:hypothetical protein
MKLKHLYLGLCVLGVVLPYRYMIPFSIEHGFDMLLLFQQPFQHSGSAFFAMDLLVSAVVFLVFVVAEGRRLDIRPIWLPIAATFTVGVSLGFPLFLYLRERRLDSRPR